MTAMESPLDPRDIDYFTGHYSGLLAYALSERLGWPVVYYFVEGEKRWRAVTVQAPNGSELSAAGFAPPKDDYFERRVDAKSDIEMLRSYYEESITRNIIDKVADKLAAFAEPGLAQA